MHIYIYDLITRISISLYMYILYTVLHFVNLQKTLSDWSEVHLRLVMRQAFGIEYQSPACSGAVVYG